VYRFLRMGSRSTLATGGLACALAVMTGCPTVDLGDTPSDLGLCNPPGGLEYFQNQIWPPAMSCAQMNCHTAAGNGLDFPNEPTSSADFYPTAFKRTQLYLNCGSPSASPMLTKPLAGIDPHGGGDLFSSESDPAVQVFLGWFQ
jgi:hypothetical protein